MDCEEIYSELKPLLIQITNDKTAAPASRAAVSTMEVLEGVFSASYCKKDGTVPQPSPEHQALHCAALSSWTLLLTLLAPADVYRRADTTVFHLRGLLESSDVDLRMTAGEGLALVTEFAYDYDEQYEPEDLDGLIASL